MLDLGADPPVISIPLGMAYTLSRVTAAHELGHYIVYSRGSCLDREAIGHSSSPEEETVAEYAGRLLLQPHAYHTIDFENANLAQSCLNQASMADVTLHSAAARLGDPDSPLSTKVIGVIFWSMLKRPPGTEKAIAQCISPAWHLCGSAFIPIRRCHAGRTSLVAKLAAREGVSAGIDSEDVQIGALRGRYRVDAVAWGSVQKRSRVVLSVFSKLE